MRLDSDAALPFEVHGVKHLRMHLARGERAGQLQQPVRERGFAVIDVRDNREIADKLAVHEKKREAEGPASGETSLTLSFIIASKYGEQAPAAHTIKPVNTNGCCQ